MANNKHLENLKQGVMAWNRWVASNDQTRPDLSWTDLNEAVLSAATLSEADLRGATLSKADLRGADLYRANLSYANLHQARLARADLQRACLGGCSLWGADLTGAIFDEETILPDFTKWTPEVDMSRFTDANHPDFWQLESPPEQQIAPEAVHNRLTPSPSAG